jgi:histone chaperone ASF1
LVTDLEWKVVYVGNAEDSTHDQVLEEVMVGPVPVGINRFVLQASAPNPAMIANQDLIGVTVILITCSFMDHKFVQIGYYVNNEYSEPFEPENPPNPVEIHKLYRNILSDQPRVTRFAIDWAGGNSPVVEVEGETEQQSEDVTEDIVDMNEEDDDEDDDEEDGDDADEVDLDNDDDEEGEEGDEEEDDEEEQEGSGTEGGGYMNVMEIINDDSNSMDVARMLQ